MIVVSYPLNPTCTCADKAFYEKLVEFAKKYNILVVHDNAYSEIEYDGRRGFSFVSLLDSAFSTTCSEAVSEELQML